MQTAILVIILLSAISSASFFSDVQSFVKGIVSEPTWRVTPDCGGTCYNGNIFITCGSGQVCVYPDTDDSYGYCAATSECAGVVVTTTVAPSCTNECSSGAAYCSSTSAIRTCGNYDSDACLEWSTSSCPGGATCEYAGATPYCYTPSSVTTTTSCSPWTYCSGSSVYTRTAACQTNYITTCSGACLDGGCATPAATTTTVAAVYATTTTVPSSATTTTIPTGATTTTIPTVGGMTTTTTKSATAVTTTTTTLSSCQQKQFCYNPAQGGAFFYCAAGEKCDGGADGYCIADSKCPILMDATTTTSTTTTTLAVGKSLTGTAAGASSSLKCQGQQPCLALTNYICDSGKCAFADDGSVYKSTLSDTLSCDFTFTSETYPEVSDYLLNIRYRKQGNVGWNTCKTTMMENSEEWKAGGKTIRASVNANECVKELGAYEFGVAGSACGGTCYTPYGVLVCPATDVCTYPVGEDTGQCTINLGCVAPFSSPVKMESNIIKMIFVKEMKPPDVMVSANPAAPLDTNIVIFSAYTSDESGVDKIIIHLDENGDGTYDKNFTCSSWACSATGGPYLPGTVSYYAEAWDSVGNRGESATSKVSVAPACPLSPTPRCGDATVFALKTNWDVTKGASPYGIEFCPSTEPFGSAACTAYNLDGSLNELQYISLTGGTDYKIRMRLYRVNGVACRPDDWSETVTCATAPAVDAPPPERSKGLPKGSLSPLTDTVSLSLETSEPSNCKYDTVPDKNYNQMPSSHTFYLADFAEQGNIGLRHAFTLSGLQPGNTYNYYVKCVGIDTGVANTDDYVISFKIPAYDASKYKDCPNGQVATNDGDCVDPMTLVGYPTDSDCTVGWPYGGNKADAKTVSFSVTAQGGETTYACNVFEVKDYKLLQMAKGIATCFSTRCGDSLCHSFCKEDYKKSGADTVRNVDTFKRFAGYYIIDGFGQAAKFMKDYFWPEVHSGWDGKGYCGPKDGFNYNAQQLQSRGHVGSPWGWVSDTDMSKNSCVLSVLPAHASINILHTGTCADYSAAVTTMLRYVGYKSNEVYSVLLNIHMYNLVKFPEDDLWHIVDTVGNVGGGVDAKWTWSPDKKTDYTHCEFGRQNQCVNDNGMVRCPQRSEVYAC